MWVGVGAGSISSESRGIEVGPLGAPRFFVATVQSTTEAPESRVAPNERRAHRRAALDRPVLLETAAKATTVRSVDVSGGGLSLRTNLTLGVGERVSVYFELPIGYGVQVEAEVRRCEGDRVALRFVDAPAEAVLAIRSFCRVSGLVPAVKTSGRLVGV